MRYVAIAVMLLAYPFLVGWIKANPQKRHWAYFGLGILPFTINAWNLDAALISWPAWVGYAKGMIFTLLDSLALAVITTHRSPRSMPPLTGFIVAYTLAAALSVAMSGIPMSSTFYVFQLVRILILFLAVARIAPDPRALKWLAMGLAAGISYQAGNCIWQKLNGAFQTAGTMGHQNLLGLMTHFTIFPLLGMLLAGMRSRVVMLGVASSLIVEALGASRGTIGFGLMGIALLLVLSLYRRATPQKWRMVGFAALALVLISPLMVTAINNREAQLATSQYQGDERTAFERAAKAMFADHPMGVGANEYVIVANASGYSVRAGVIWNGSSRAAYVHNAYLLVAAETGWPGLLSFIALFAAVIWSGLYFAFQNRRDPRGDVVLGCTVAVIVTAEHNFYEWIFVTYQAQYVFAISIGIIAGLVRERAIEQRAARSRQRKADFSRESRDQDVDKAEQVAAAQSAV